MKKQIKRKKLQLSSETLRRLTDRNLAQVAGGTGTGPLAVPSEDLNGPDCDSASTKAYG